MNNKRLLSIDILRGLAIVVLIIIHRIHYNWVGMSTHEGLKEYMSGIMLPILIFFIVLLSMAGVFYFITGIVNTYTIYHRIESGKNKWWQTILFGFAGGIWLLILNYIQRLFFMNGFLVGENGNAPKYPIGYFTGLIRNHEQVTFYWQQVTEPGTLSLIGLLLIIISLIVSILLKFRNKLTLNQMQLILIFFAISSMVASIFIKLYVSPEYVEHFAAGHYLRAAICGHICKDFSLFPYIGYAFTGAAFGLSISFNETRKILFRKVTYITGFLIVTGVFLYLVFDKQKFGGRGTLGALVTLVELGLFIQMLYILIKRFDFVTSEKQLVKRNRSKSLRRFGMISLTIFITEPILAEVLKKGIDFLAGESWSNYLGFVFLFSLFCLLIWHYILIFWQKVNYIGSVEWLTGKILFLFVKKKSGKTSFQDI